MHIEQASFLKNFIKLGSLGFACFINMQTKTNTTSSLEYLVGIRIINVVWQYHSQLVKTGINFIKFLSYHLLLQLVRQAV